MSEFVKGDKVKVTAVTQSQLPSNAIGWQGVIYANNLTEYGRLWVLFPTGFIGRDEIWYVHPSDMVKI